MEAPVGPRLDGVVTKERRRVNGITQAFDSWGVTKAVVLVSLADARGAQAAQRIADAYASVATDADGLT